jgi:hypothetical protein
MTHVQEPKGTYNTKEKNMNQQQYPMFGYLSPLYPHYIPVHSPLQAQ